MRFPLVELNTKISISYFSKISIPYSRFSWVDPMDLKDASARVFSLYFYFFEISISRGDISPKWVCFSLNSFWVIQWVQSQEKGYQSQESRFKKVMDISISLDNHKDEDIWVVRRATNFVY